MSRPSFIFASLLAMSAPVAAETCNFTSECYEDESCAETTFSMEVHPDKLVTDAETIPVGTGGSDTVNVFVGYTANGFHVLTREVNGQARYATHYFEGPIMINYIGTCSS